MLKKELNRLEVSLDTPYKQQVIALEKGQYVLRLIHQNDAVFKRLRSLFFSFAIEGKSPEEVKEILGLRDISDQFGAFAYVGAGSEESGYFVKELILNVMQKVAVLNIDLRTFLPTENIFIEAFQVFNAEIPLEEIYGEGTNGLFFKAEETIDFSPKVEETISVIETSKDYSGISLKEIDKVSLKSFSVNPDTPKKIILNDLEAGNYVLKITHQSQEIFEKHKSLFFTFSLPDVDNDNEVKDILGLSSISSQHGVFSYAGGGTLIDHDYQQEIVLNIRQPILTLIIELKSFQKIDLIINHFEFSSIDSTRDTFDSQFVSESEQNHDVVPDEKKAAVEKKDLLKKESPILLKIEDILLSKSIAVKEFDIEIVSGKTLEFILSSEYQNIVNNNKRALLLLSFYDSTGGLLGAPTNLLWIDKFNSYYKYLPDTGKSIEKIYNCQVPPQAIRAKIGVVGFNLKELESIQIRSLLVKYEEKSIPTSERNTTSFLLPSKAEQDISILGWVEEINEGKPTILGVMDEFTQGCFSADVNLIQPRTDNWYALSEKYNPSLMFIESAWKGNSGNWQYRVSKYSNKPGLEIAQLCHYSKDKSIPTVFWNKEDPVHHDRFMESAAEAEYIFTTDENMIESYKNRTGNSKVYTLPFAAQPLLHKPKSLVGRRNKSCFAGSWYGNRHVERGAVIVWLLDAAKKYGLDIYDRNYTLGHSPFPPQYQNHVIGSLPYLDLCEEYRNYRVFLNVNSVTNSPTMFSRRVFELMACGTPVVSTYSQGITELFNSDAVWLVDSEEEAYEALRILMTDDKEWRRRSLAGIREIFQSHTYAHRLNYIFEKTDVAQRINVSPRVLVNVFIKDKSDIDFACSFKSSQRYQNYELLLIYDESFIPLDVNDHNAISIKELPKYLEDYSFDLFGMITNSHRYGDNYLVDLVNAYIYEPEAKALILCDTSMREKAFEYYFCEFFDGVLLKSKQDYLQKLDQHISQEKVDKYEAYFIDSDEFIKI